MKKPRKIGNGWRRRGAHVVRIVVSFDDETFEQVRQRAIKDNVPFAEQVRRLVEWGLQA